MQERAQLRPRVKVVELERELAQARHVRARLQRRQEAPQHVVRAPRAHDEVLHERAALRGGVRVRRRGFGLGLRRRRRVAAVDAAVRPEDALGAQGADRAAGGDGVHEDLGGEEDAPDRELAQVRAREGRRALGAAPPHAVEAEGLQRAERGQDPREALRGRGQVAVLVVAGAAEREALDEAREVRRVLEQPGEGLERPRVAYLDGAEEVVLARRAPAAAHERTVGEGLLVVPEVVDDLVVDLWREDCDGVWVHVGERLGLLSGIRWPRGLRTSRHKYATHPTLGVVRGGRASCTVPRAGKLLLVMSDVRTV